jgi:hypothetical protein
MPRRRRPELLAVRAVRLIRRILAIHTDFTAMDSRGKPNFRRVVKTLAGLLKVKK